MFEAKVIADSVCKGHRLTTMQLTHPRIIHAEFMTHAMFARNASSSRAIPFEKMVERVMMDPFVPKQFPVNRPGMQATEYLRGSPASMAKSLWLTARNQAVRIARQIADPDALNVHKQIANRLLEPWMWITVCCTGDAGAWSNYFSLRCHPDAEENIQEQAYMAQLAYFTSDPKEMKNGDWHLPYILEQETAAGYGGVLVKVSTGRCARTSYLTQEGKHDPVADINLHDRLLNHRPMHASPFEHVCMATEDDQRYGKYTGWKSYRHMLKGEYTTNFKPNHPQLGV